MALAKRQTKSGRKGLLEALWDICGGIGRAAARPCTG
jgi:hypothetical protein